MNSCIVPAIAESVFPENRVYDNAVSIYKAITILIIESTSEIIELSIFIPDIPTISERIYYFNPCFSQFTDRLTPRIVLIFYHRVSGSVNDANNITLKVVDVSKLLDDVANVQDKRNEEVYSEIKPFNAQHKSSLRIVYRQNKKVNEPPLEEWLFGNRYDENAWYNGFNIKQQDIAGFFYYSLNEHGFFGFLKKVLHNEFLTEKDVEEFLSLATKMDQKMVDREITAMKLSEA